MIYCVGEFPATFDEDDEGNARQCRAMPLIFVVFYNR